MASATPYTGVRNIRKLSTYQAMLAETRIEGRIEGHTEEARRNVLLPGIRRFGPPDARQRARIEIEASLEQLEIWLLALLEASGWGAVLNPPAGSNEIGVEPLQLLEPIRRLAIPRPISVRTPR